MIETMRSEKNDLTHGVHKSFETLKQRIEKLPKLSLLDSSKIPQVDYDASGSVIEFILSQEGWHEDFYSEKLNDAKKIYLVYD